MRWVRKRIVWIASAVVGGFLLWLVGTAVSIQSLSRAGAGSLFGKRVSLADFSQAVAAVTHDAVLTHGDRYRTALTHEAIESRAWERLLLLAEAKRRRIRVSDPEVVEEIARWPLFWENGAFDSRSYETILRYSLGVSPRLFEEEIRQHLAIAKLVRLAMGEPAVKDEELLELFKKREGQIRVSSLKLPAEPLAREVADAARANPSLLEKVGKQMKLKTAGSDFFKAANSLSSLGVEPAALAPAFQLEAGQTAGPFPAKEGWLVVRLEERKPADESAFPDQKEKLKQELAAQKRFMAYLTWYAELTNRASLKKEVVSPKR
ncbi:MAG: peptidylprolyl isomerase [Candidatus Omnitrophica bacterium]|nr:peptidylprolyl isomerase [Candidatus Omnitrophota bacterium]